MNKGINIINAVTTRHSIIPAGRRVELQDVGLGSFFIVRAETDKGAMMSTEPFSLFLLAGDFERVPAPAAPAPKVVSNPAKNLRDAEAMADGLSPAVIQSMREWASDCQWLDGEDLNDYTDGQIVQGIAIHYAGGVSQFVIDCEPVRVPGKVAMNLTATPKGMAEELAQAIALLGEARAWFGNMPKGHGSNELLFQIDQFLNEKGKA